MANIEEYKMHREEIMYLMKKRDSFLTYAYTVMAGIWSISFTTDIGWITLFGMSLLVVFALKNLDLTKSLMRLSAYLLKCLEPHLDIKWETLNTEYHSDNDDKEKAKFHFLLGRLDFIILQFVNVCVFWVIEYEYVFTNNILSIVIIIAQILVFLYQIRIAYKDSKSSTYKEDSIKKWGEVLNKYEKEHSNVQKD